MLLGSAIEYYFATNKKGDIGYITGCSVFITRPIKLCNKTMLNRKSTNKLNNT